MRDNRAVAAVDNLVLLLVAVLAFSLFFSSLAGAYVERQRVERGARLQAIADALLATVMDAPGWTAGRGRLLASSLTNATGETLAEVAASHPFRVVVWDLVHDTTWTLARGESLGDRRTAIASANVVSVTVDPARVTATVWGS